MPYLHLSLLGNEPVSAARVPQWSTAAPPASPSPRPTTTRSYLTSPTGSTARTSSARGSRRATSPRSSSLSHLTTCSRFSLPTTRSAPVRGRQYPRPCRDLDLDLHSSLSFPASQTTVLREGAEQRELLDLGRGLYSGVLHSVRRGGVHSHLHLLLTAHSLSL